MTWTVTSTQGQCTDAIEPELFLWRLSWNFAVYSSHNTNLSEREKKTKVGGSRQENVSTYTSEPYFGKQNKADLCKGRQPLLDISGRNS